MENNNYQTLLSVLYQQIRNNNFKSKEALNNYIIYLKNNLIPSEVLSNEKVLELLNLYDSIHQNDNPKLDMRNYKASSLSNQNFIISTQTDTVLKTNFSNKDLNNEFKKIQNEITSSQTQDELANSDIVFAEMKENRKEELTLLSINEVLQRDDIDSEVLRKIRFFINNEYINPYSYKVDINTGLFYNQETKEMFEVRKNPQTGNYEIYKGSEVEYSKASETEEHSNESLEGNNDFEEEDQEINKDIDKQQMLYKSKVRRLIKPTNLNNAAFVKSSFIVIGICIFSVILAIILINK